MPRTRKPVTPEAEAHASVQPPRAPTGLPQGEHAALISSQQAQPVDNQQGRLQMAIQAAAAGQAPPLGDGAALGMPTQLPDQPVTAGLPMGAGPGPEAVPAPIVPTTIDDQNMARRLPMLEAMADRPDASDQLRSWVRRLRGTMPPSITMASIAQQPPAAPTA
jgi:hypothetical protein